MPDTPNTNAKNTDPSNLDKLDKLDGESLDITAQRLAAIKAVLPEAFDLDGNLVRDKLLEALKPASYKASDDIPSFGLAWPGKQSAFAAAGVPTTATLRPCPEQSVDFDITKNLLIEGDNLEVLKTLDRSYHGKVKMIYIDPPYNTGKDFVYPDNYSEGLQTYLQRTEQKDDHGFWKSTNSETSGRKHANWLSMMAPRLIWARNLLRQDGVIFISIDDNEVANLRLLCDEVFGAENFVANQIWQSRTSISDDHEISMNHNHTLIYSKSKNNLEFAGESIDASEYSNNDDDPRGPWKLVPIDANKPGGDTIYPITNPNTGVDYLPPEGRSWSINRDSYQELLDDNRIAFGKKGDSAPKKKLFYKERMLKGETKTPSSLLLNAGTTKDGSSESSALMNKKKIFSYPKPTSLIRRFVCYGARPSADKPGNIILDFFAGSGTTGHAVMTQNAEDGGNRRYICVQLPEPLDEPVTLDDGVVCETIFDLTRERLKRAGKKIKEEAGLNADKLDTGLRVFKLDSSNFTAWNSDPTTSEADLLERLEQLNDQTVAGRSETDILWEMLLKMGLPLDLQLEHFELEGASFIGVADRTKVISTQEEIPLSALEALLDQDIPPSELVVLDSAFADDSARANIATLYKERKDDDGQPVCKLKVV